LTQSDFENTREHGKSLLIQDVTKIDVRVVKFKLNTAVAAEILLLMTHN